MIAGGRIVQVESSAAPAQAVSWVPSRAANPNHHASRGLLPPAYRCPGHQAYGVSRDTVRRTMALLRDEGVVFTVPHRGTYVGPRPK